MYSDIFEERNENDPKHIAYSAYCLGQKFYEDGHDLSSCPFGDPNLSRFWKMGWHGRPFYFNLAEVHDTINESAKELNKYWKTEGF